MGVRERKVETYLKESCKKHLENSMCEKWGTQGNPDRIVIYKGVVYFVEIKTVDGKLQINQALKITKFKDAGANILTLYGHKDIDNFIKSIK